MKLHGFGLAGYRSFYSLQRLGPLAKINLVIGRNNSGKSNILRYAKQHLAATFKLREGGNLPDFKDVDLPKTFGGKRYQSGFCVVLPPPGSDEFKLWAQGLTLILREPSEGFLEVLIDKTGGWLEYTQDETTGRVVVAWEQIQNLAAGGLYRGVWAWDQLIGRLLGSYTNDRSKNIGECLLRIARLLPEPPPVVLVPALRGIKGSKDGETTGLDGTGLIEQLCRLKDPEHHEQELRDDFESICEFLREITGDPQAAVEIPHTRSTLNIRLEGRILPLDAVGTGIHEAIIIAAAAALHPRSLICLEEPEIHLHPILQRKLVRHLATRTNSQYLIATHSTHLMDFPGAAIFHVALDDEKKSVVRPVRTPADKSTVCVDLGYRPTDLLQTNCVVWVEGPSDRIYLKYWLEHFLRSTGEATELVEGIHYSIMFYGGRLLFHLTPDDPEVEEFVSLRSINRFVAMVIDGDREKKGAKINATKARVQESIERGETKNDPGFVWLTKGREIENYIRSSAIEDAVSHLYANLEVVPRVDEQYDQIQVVRPGRKASARRPENFDKVKVARYIVENHEPDFDVLDLKDQLKRLVGFIQRANRDR